MASYLSDRQACLSLAGMCRDPSRRFVGEWAQGHPAKWHCTQVLNPKTGCPFCDDEAWEFIAERIEDFQAVKVVDLHSPPGTQGYEMNMVMGLGVADLYVKIALSKSGKSVIGRSFHYSDK